MKKLILSSLLLLPLFMSGCAGLIVEDYSCYNPYPRVVYVQPSPIYVSSPPVYVYRPTVTILKYNYSKYHGCR